jgi:hypothetical protein
MYHKIPRANFIRLLESHSKNLLIQPLIAKVKGGQEVSFISKLKTLGIQTLVPTVFYGAVGIIFLVLLPLANFPPHIGLTGIISLIAAYGILTKRFWALWLVVALFAVATVFSLYTLYVIAFTNVIVSVSMLVYAVLTWFVTLYIVLKRKPTET